MLQNYTEGGASEDGHHGDHVSSLNHTIEQENYFFNPHLHPVTEQKFIVYGILIPVFGSISVFLNLIVYLTLFHKNRKKGSSALSLFLQCLAGYDVCVSLLSIWIYAIPTLFKHHGIYLEYLNNVHPQLLPYLAPILHMAITGSDYLNLAAAVERYIALDQHFKKTKTPHHGCQVRQTVMFIVVILAFTVAFNFPAIWERKVIINVNGEMEVIPTSLRFHDIYVKMYRLMAEFLIFKVTPWLTFLILFLSMKDRIHNYIGSKAGRKSLTVSHYLEMMDSRIIIGINTLFYLTNALPLYISFCHIALFDVSYELVEIANLTIVMNSTFKFFIYLALSNDFRRSLDHFFCGNDGSNDNPEYYHWMNDFDKSRAFLNHTKIVMFAQTNGGPNEEEGNTQDTKNLCKDVDD